MRITQRCESTEPYFVQLIPSETQKNLIYEVHSVWPDDSHTEYICGCPAFQFKGKCKHQKMAWEDRCMWAENHDDDSEIQSDEQKAKRICPRCGQKTIKEEFLD